MAMRLEGADLWGQARALVCAVYGVTGRGGFFRDVSLRDDLRREAISFLSAVGEAAVVLEQEDRGTLLSTARTTAIRMRSCLVVASDLGYLSAVELEALLGQVGEVLGALLEGSNGATGDSLRAEG